jgi:hypothetical protein
VADATIKNHGNVHLAAQALRGDREAILRADHGWHTRSWAQGAASPSSVLIVSS